MQWIMVLKLVLVRCLRRRTRRTNSTVVTDEPVECENNQLSVRNNRLSLGNNWLKFKTLGKWLTIQEQIYEIHLKLIKRNRKITACNQLDLETLRIWLIMPKNLRRHCYGYIDGNWQWLIKCASITVGLQGCGTSWVKYFIFAHVPLLVPELNVVDTHKTWFG